MRLEGPQSDYTKQVLYKRIREMEQGTLKQDEINHLRKQNRIKITVKSPKRFAKQKQQPNTQKRQPQSNAPTPKKKMRIVVKRNRNRASGKPWRGLL